MENKKYFTYNNVRIIISEHFKNDGKSIKEVIKDAICRETRLTPVKNLMAAS